jgi:hypothetical protein
MDDMCVLYQADGFQQAAQVAFSPPHAKSSIQVLEMFSVVVEQYANTLAVVHSANGLMKR